MEHLLHFTVIKLELKKGFQMRNAREVEDISELLTVLLHKVKSAMHLIQYYQEEGSDLAKAGQAKLACPVRKMSLAKNLISVKNNRN